MNIPTNTAQHMYSNTIKWRRSGNSLIESSIFYLVSWVHLQRDRTEKNALSDFDPFIYSTVSLMRLLTNYGIRLLKSGQLASPGR